MLKYIDPKLYRKFLILAVMIGGLYMVSSINSASAMPCCSVCDANYEACVEACYNPNPGKWQQCIQEECQIYMHCYYHCDPYC